MQLPRRLISFITYAISFVDYEQPLTPESKVKIDSNKNSINASGNNIVVSTATGILKAKLFVESLGRYGNGCIMY